jgi:hypothetical protein
MFKWTVNLKKLWVILLLIGGEFQQRKSNASGGANLH